MNHISIKTDPIGFTDIKICLIRFVEAQLMFILMLVSCFTTDLSVAFSGAFAVSQEAKTAEKADTPAKTAPCIRDFYKIRHQQEIWSVERCDDGRVSALLHWRPFYEYDWFNKTPKAYGFTGKKPRPLIGMSLLDAQGLQDHQDGYFTGKLYLWQRGVSFKAIIRFGKDRLVIDASRPDAQFQTLAKEDIVRLVLELIDKDSVPAAPALPLPLFDIGQKD